MREVAGVRILHVEYIIGLLVLEERKEAVYTTVASDWATLSMAFPRLQAVPGAKLLEDLDDWLVTSRSMQASFPLPNILLTPLVVITELTYT